jgi:photosystem II stability/assembly factor-like uncharacterized protein
VVKSERRPENHLWHLARGAGALALVGLTFAACDGPQSSPHPQRHRTGEVRVTTTSSTRGEHVTTMTTAPTGFEATASSFINPQEGWVLGASSCQSCAALDVTDDGGSTWQSLPALPVALGPNSRASSAVSDVYFADPSDGFLFGPGLEMTHDGGLTWGRANLPPVAHLVGGAGYVYALSEATSLTGASLWRTTIGSNSWSSVAMPKTTGAFSLAAEGSTLVLFQGGLGISGPAANADQLGALWISTDAGTNWMNRSVPCTTTDGGAALVSIALGHPDAWLVDCYDGEQSSQEQDTQHHLYGTSDEGENWVRLVDPTHMGGPDLLADNGSGHAFLATESGGGDQLVGTFDGGLGWSPVLTPSVGFSGWADLEFVDASTGFIVADEQLYRTQDGGRTWTGLKIPRRRLSEMRHPGGPRPLVSGLHRFRSRVSTRADHDVLSGRARPPVQFRN